MNILVASPKGDTRDTFFTKEVIDKLQSMGNLIWNNTERQFTKEELRENLKGVDVCITGWGTGKFDSYVLQEADTLRILAHTGGTVANIASEALYDKGIKVISGNSMYAESVAEGVIAYVLCALRELPYYSNEMKQGGWRRDNFNNEGLLDNSVGLIGFGAVSKCLIKFLAPFRCNIRIYDPFVSDEVFHEYGVQRGELDEIFKQCKIVSLHVPQRPETYHMIDKRLLKMLQNGALLINTARGSVIDEDALVAELEEHRFKAVLDVFEVEPLREDSKLRKLENAVLIPHMAGPTVDRRAYITMKLLEDIERFFNKEELLMEISKKYGLSMTL
jgi:phosphoglycerate dehydrogenase-like enzyme